MIGIAHCASSFLLVCLRLIFFFVVFSSSEHGALGGGIGSILGWSLTDRPKWAL